MENFEPIKKDEVSMFICGPTVQDYMHLGHARTYVFYDVVRRYLESIGYRVRLLMNITDIDESIEAKAGYNVEDFVAEKASAYRNSMERLNIGPLYGFERVSRYVNDAIDQISSLMVKGYAYVTREAVFFDTSKVENFGELAHLEKNELELRPLELSPEKKHILDFSLWRNYQSRTINFSSPWGNGWPGWHIQDTAVAMKMLGAQYDIHGGAYDLIYPHHVSEIAIAEALTGLRPYVKYWIYTGFVTTGGKKMSKSEGNVTYIDDLMKKHSADAIRLYLLSKRYSENLDHDPEGIEVMNQMISEVKEKLERVNPSITGSSLGFYQTLINLIEDDFNTPKLIDAIYEAANEPQRFGITLSEAKPQLIRAGSILGVGLDSA